METAILKVVEDKMLNVDGIMTIDKTEDGLRRLDFLCTEDVETEPFSGVFKVQAMHDGCMYMDEKPKRKRNKPLFRQDNSSLSLGKNGVYYFVFTMPETQIDELPETLVSEAREVARKIIRSHASEVKNEK